MSRRPWDHGGKSRQSRGYGAAHDRMRAHLIATVILCEECRRSGRVTVGSHADHILPIARGGTSERDNYQLLCRDCHWRKSQIERGRTARPKRTISPDGWPIDEE